MPPLCHAVLQCASQVLDFQLSVFHRAPENSPGGPSATTPARLAPPAALMTKGARGPRRAVTPRERLLGARGRLFSAGRVPRELRIGRAGLVTRPGESFFFRRPLRGAGLAGLRPAPARRPSSGAARSVPVSSRRSGRPRSGARRRTRAFSLQPDVARVRRAGVRLEPGERHRATCTASRTPASRRRPRRRPSWRPAR